MQTLDNINTKKWIVAIVGTILQMVLGTVYAWSYFQNPIKSFTGWTHIQVSWIFSLSICFLGLGSLIGGIILPKFGPRKLAVCGTIMWSMGWILGSVALKSQNLLLLYFSYGILGGLGLGFSYVTPVATVNKWFTKNKGLVTGMVVMGFGLGAFLLSKLLAPFLMDYFKNDLTEVFFYIGIAVIVVGVPSAFMMNNPPISKTDTKVNIDKKVDNSDTLTAKDCLTSGKFIKIWLLFFMNIAAGMIFIGLQSPIFQEILKSKMPIDTDFKSKAVILSLAASGATLIAISSIANGIGRFLWGMISDKIGRIWVFRIILASQIIVFLLLININIPWLFSVLVCYVLLCYGGGFGTMPSLIGDVFSEKLMPIVYGGILTAWSMAGIAGPQIASYFKENYASMEANKYTFIAGAIMLSIGFLISLTLNDGKYLKTK